MSNNVKTLYRIERPCTGGMWYNADGTFNPIICSIPYAKARSLDMSVDKGWYFNNGYVWKSSVDTLSNLIDWFPEQDIKALLDKGFKVYKITSSICKEDVNQFLYTEAGTISKVEIDFLKELLNGV